MSNEVHQLYATASNEKWWDDSEQLVSVRLHTVRLGQGGASLSIAVSAKLLLFQAPGYGASSLSPHYGGGQRGGVMGGSPQAAASPHHTASPQVPSPQGQTLDLSVSRVPARWVLIMWRVSPAAGDMLLETGECYNVA
jgi:hypothetical protein